jgi:hypothetical protein
MNNNEEERKLLRNFKDSLEWIQANQRYVEPLNQHITTTAIDMTVIIRMTAVCAATINNNTYLLERQDHEIIEQIHEYVTARQQEIRRRAGAMFGRLVRPRDDDDEDDHQRDKGPKTYKSSTNISNSPGSALERTRFCMEESIIQPIFKGKYCALESSVDHLANQVAQIKIEPKSQRNTETKDKDSRHHAQTNINMNNLFELESDNNEQDDHLASNEHNVFDNTDNVIKKEITVYSSPPKQAAPRVRQQIDQDDTLRRVIEQQARQSDQQRQTIDILTSKLNQLAVDAVDQRQLIAQVETKILNAVHQRSVSHSVSHHQPTTPTLQKEHYMDVQLQGQRKQVLIMDKESVKEASPQIILPSVAKLCTIRPTTVITTLHNCIVDDNAVRVDDITSCMPNYVILIAPTEATAEVNLIEVVQANNIITCHRPFKYPHPRSTQIQVFSNIKVDTSTKNKVVDTLTLRSPTTSPMSHITNQRDLDTEYLRGNPRNPFTKLDDDLDTEHTSTTALAKTVSPKRSITDPTIELSAVSLLTEASNWAHMTFPVQRYYHPLDKDNKLMNYRKLDPLMFSMEGELYSRFLKKQIAQEQILGTKLLAFIFIMRSKTWIKPSSPAWTRFDHISERDLESNNELISEEDQIEEYQRLQKLIGEVMEVPFDRDSVIEKLYAVPRATSQHDLMRLFADISNVFNEYPAWLQNPKNTLDAIKKGLSNLPKLRRRFIKENRNTVHLILNATVHDTKFSEWRDTFGTSREPETVIKIMQHVIHSLFREAELLIKDGIVDEDDDDIPIITNKSTNKKHDTSKTKTTGQTKLQDFANNKFRSNYSKRYSSPSKSSIAAIAIGMDPKLEQDLTDLYQAKTILGDPQSRAVASVTWANVCDFATEDEMTVLNAISNDDQNNYPALKPADEQSNDFARHLVEDIIKNEHKEDEDSFTDSYTDVFATFAGNSGYGPKGAPGSDPSSEYRHLNDNRPFTSNFICPICGNKPGQKPYSPLLTKLVNNHRRGYCPIGEYTHTPGKSSGTQLDYDKLAKLPQDVSNAAIDQCWRTGCISLKPKDEIEIIKRDIQILRDRNNNESENDNVEEISS